MSGNLNEQICREAAAWWLDFRSGDMDATRRRAFDAWLRASPEHLRAFLEMATIWQEASAVDAGRTLNVEALIAELTEEPIVMLPSTPVDGTDGRQATSAPLDRRRGGGWISGLAAALVLALLIAGYVLWTQRQPLYSTAVGEQRELHLADGTVVTLNSRSSLRVEFSAAARTVELTEGQALFRVVRNPARPFIVHARDRIIQDIGTQFDVNVAPRGLVVTVLEGTVAAGGAGEAPVVINAGEQLTLNNGAARGAPTPVDVSSATAWTQGRIVLQSQTLSQVAEAFNRYSRRRLVGEDRGDPLLHLSGVFATDPDFLMQYLRERPDITVRESRDQIEFIRAPNH